MKYTALALMISLLFVLSGCQKTEQPAPAETESDVTAEITVVPTPAAAGMAAVINVK